MAKINLTITNVNNEFNSIDVKLGHIPTFRIDSNEPMKQKKVTCEVDDDKDEDEIFNNLRKLRIPMDIKIQVESFIFNNIFLEPCYKNLKGLKKWYNNKVKSEYKWTNTEEKMIETYSLEYLDNGSIEMPSSITKSGHPEIFR